VLIRGKAAALTQRTTCCRLVLETRSWTSGFRSFPGWDVAGAVESLGAGVTEFAEGDKFVWQYSALVSFVGHCRGKLKVSR
jgi:NADPH:quinone reductase-like Zn-dependent oxidoreductase